MLFALYTTFGLKLIPVSGSSMNPTIAEGEFILVDLLSYHWFAIQSGEIILFTNEHNQYIVKRVIQDSTSPVIITAEGVMLTPQHQLLSLDPSVLITLKNREILDPNWLFVAGDNRLASKDSRNYGPIHRNQVVGRILRIGKHRL
jgi:signal peptidase I